ncbi:ornithine decarboxylase [Hypericibacter terrae]|jgi:ornithine decarboxylase|uniref:ornithine decarboxylase n=1 Tax=Hypericibacter terrae TaxID=2602015 RepID=A0A5J6MKC5_9PROT|nr:type III PLP-dependent enzyme [Hypericibacter terrae]QEX17707.1 ornithine decarboxylase [Hypericibacter terrae]
MERHFENVRAMVTALTPSYPVYCLRPHVLRRAATRFLELFPGRVLFAVKCNPHPAVLRILYEAGIRHFDTASLPEIAQVRESYPDAGAYFMHPVKSRAAIQAATRIYGVDTFTVDHPDELTKVLDQAHGGEGVTIMVRIKTPPVEGVLYHLAGKFGAEPLEAAGMLKEAHARGCQVGLAFHVGSQCLVPEAYSNALKICGDVIEQAGTPLQYLDVGGGFPAEYVGTNMPPLEAYMNEIEKGAKALKLRRDCVLMCEPGRALVAESMSSVVQVQLRKDDRLYINDGVYGSFSEMVTAGIRLPAEMVRLNGGSAREMKSFQLMGPTCDSVDVLPGTFELPADIHEGDWIEIDRLGAYSFANTTRFNGFYPDTLVTCADEPLGRRSKAAA